MGRKRSVGLDRPDRLQGAFFFTPREDADFAIQRIGRRAGWVYREMWRSDQAHYFIRGNVEGTKRELQPAFAEVASNTAGKPSFAMSEVVAI